jgi:RHS repeat-associated protein
LIQEGPSATVPERIYVHGAGTDRIVASYRYSTGAAFYFYYDALGNCILASDAYTGNIAEQYDYDAFGHPYFYDSAGTPLPNGSTIGTRFLFTGREWLSDLKLYDYRNRLYQPELGRFMQPDPIHFGGETAKDTAQALGSPKNVTPSIDYNLYRYCHNDPINRADPLGLHDLNVLPWNEQIKDNADKSKLYPNLFTIAGHGEPGGMIDSRKNELPATKLAALVRENSKFKEGMPVRLDSCNTGVDVGDGSLPYAQQLANALGSVVWAPIGEPAIDENGRVTMETRGGRWLPFFPQSKK